MPARCSVPGCKSNYRDAKVYVTVYSFPRDEELRKSWCKAIGRENWSPTRYSTVCRNHFKDDDIVNHVSWYDSKLQARISAPLTQTRVKEYAVPSVFDNLFPIDPVSKRIIRTKKASSKPRVNKRALTRVVFPPTDVKKDVNDLIADLMLEETEHPKKMHLRKLLGLCEDDKKYQNPFPVVANDPKPDAEVTVPSSRVNNQLMNAATAANILLELNSPQVGNDSSKDVEDTSWEDLSNEDGSLSSSDDRLISETNEVDTSENLLTKVIADTGKVPANVTVKIFNVIQQIICENCDYQPVCPMKDEVRNENSNVVVYESASKPTLSRDGNQLDQVNKEHSSNDSSANDFDVANMKVCVTKDVVENICNMYNNIKNYETLELKSGSNNYETDGTTLLQIKEKLNFYMTFVDKMFGKVNECTSVISLVPVSAQSIACTYKSNRPFKQKRRKQRAKVDKDSNKRKADSVKNGLVAVQCNKYNLRHKKINFRDLVGMTNKDEIMDEENLEVSSNRFFDSDYVTKRQKITSTDVKLIKEYKERFEDVAGSKVYIETDHCDDDDNDEDFDILRYHKLVSNKVLRKSKWPVFDKEIRIVLEKCDWLANKLKSRTDVNDIFGNGTYDTGEGKTGESESLSDMPEETIENIQMFVTNGCVGNTFVDVDDNEVVEEEEEEINNVGNESLEDTKENILNVDIVEYNATGEAIQVNSDVIANMKEDRLEEFVETNGEECDVIEDCVEDNHANTETSKCPVQAGFNEEINTEVEEHAISFNTDPSERITGVQEVSTNEITNRDLKTSVEAIDTVVFDTQDSVPLNQCDKNAQNEFKDKFTTEPSDKNKEDQLINQDVIPGDGLTNEYEIQDSELINQSNQEEVEPINQDNIEESELIKPDKTGEDASVNQEEIFNSDGVVLADMPVESSEMVGGLVIREVTISADGSSEVERNEDEMVTQTEESSACQDGVVIIEKDIRGLVEEDSSDEDDVELSGSSDVVIVQGYVDGLVEDDEDGLEDELLSCENIMYCTYNEDENVIEKISDNVEEVDYIMDATNEENGVHDKLDCHEEGCRLEEKHFEESKCGGNIKCYICHKMINRDSLQRHIKRHTGVKFCPYCSKSYVDIMKYNEHIAKHKTNEGNEKYMCFICRKKFCFLKNMYKHLRRAHPNDTKYNDTIILLPDNGNNDKNNAFLNNEKKLKKRMKNCHICNQLVTNFYYKRHMQCHSGERPFGCPLCEKRFYEKSTLKNHIRTHTGERPYKCEHCNKSFGHISTLAKHLNIHTGAKKFQCSICCKSVSSSYNLKLHHRIHTGEKPFPCCHCSKRFTSKVGLDKHTSLFHVT